MRIAFIVQRYGLEVNGGAEALCRWVAERLHKYGEVEVLTTCALDYLTWNNHLPAGESLLNGVTVRRFPVDSPRDMKQFNAFARTLFARKEHDLLDELTWIRMQGPYSSALLTYIKEHENHYDLFIFVTYSYLTTFLGVQLVPGKSILIPAAHDEPHFSLSAFRPIFHLPKGLIFSTTEERRLVHSHWKNERIPWCIAGVGLEAGEQDESSRTSELQSMDAQAEFPEPYILYAGRIDVMKGCQDLIHDFLWYLRQRDSNVHLVLLGKQSIDIPDHPNIHAPGFVTDERKEAAIRRAALVINPSEYESLSLLLLEAWQAEVPVIVNGRSDVLAEHCLSSNGGLYYTNRDELALCLDLLLADETLRQKMGVNGKQYVTERYSQDRVEKTYRDFSMTYVNA